MEIANGTTGGSKLYFKLFVTNLGIVVFAIAVRIET